MTGVTPTGTIPRRRGTADLDQQPWTRCRSCPALLYRKRLRRNLDVCPECGDHRRLDAPDRIAQLVDRDTFRQLPGPATQVDPIGFVDSMPYPQRLAAARAETGLAEAVLCGTATLGGYGLVLAVMDFRFLGGSLGSVTGELITRAAEHALTNRLPLLLVTASGGARMQEGVLALMQMATISQAIAALREAGLLTVSLVTDPTYGGVAASFATCTDIVLAETGSRLGFAGPRVIRETIRQTLPADFQTTDFLLRHGQVDMVVERRALRARLRWLLAAAASAPGRPARTASTPDRATGALPPPNGLSGAAADPAAGTWRGDAGPDDWTDAWRIVRSARHTGRPTTLDYLATAFDGFVELHGDRLGVDCAAVVAGLARLGDRYVAVVGHQKGHQPRELRARNFGMASPAGYRKAMRVMRLAARLGLPVVTLIDTPGAYPGVEAEQQGQAAAIAESILAMTGLPIPVVAVIIGEGGSGGALALAVADRVLMLRNAVYSVISPEGCAAILWHDRAAVPQAADALRLTAPDLLRLGVADEIVAEPSGGAHRNPAGAARLLRRALLENLAPLLEVPAAELVRRRRRRFRRYGAAASVLPSEAGPE
ncbi:acetyl-CoA carboxylase carboxyltransferase subunit alpha [Plantactinospora sp. KLBMP9567]|uniref:acetyl-CoA carboxylase carboxyltransferase subunit alpha n=1 Tax=Plantactinospora sp. KLBMP9567 TaxID=3085900 RepID=UPI002981183E|nr:acetyl-CoA carboxylase carboxyltransferase subunit alpha [Plantactinospora sp. KLBMP9567]MDW5325102.1 acetyl-CoA carboxylase carboxyltransferase subunit alpha [Plantactinospora sp. KLBMP9567]MDW5329303.1 acetyl-CoA carboxylase carboxyltransferase subunit alpha [Plantactinospora sp. KLBMP9567]